MLNFQHSQIIQHEFEKFADLLLRYPTVYATSKFDVGKINSKNKEQAKYQFTYMTKSIDYLTF